MSRSRGWALATMLVAAGCDTSTSPVLPECTGERGFRVNLAVGEHVSFSPLSTFGCAILPAQAVGADTAEYLLVPQSATGTPGASSSFRLSGDTVQTPPVAHVAAFPRQPSGAERFHTFLRRAERSRGAAFRPAPSAAGAPGLLLGAPPDSGSTRQFSICAALDCSVFQTVTATAVLVRGPVALYLDVAAPAGGLIPEDFDTLANVLTAPVHSVVTGTLGATSDIDRNSVVSVLMTPVVNALIPSAECDEGFVAGFFFGPDIDPIYATDTRVNRAEIIYSLVADPDSTLSCPHSRNQVKALAPVLVAHELQHMVSFNEHVLSRNGDPEVLWLNEGLSHFAEELVGRAFLPDSVAFRRFVTGNLFNAFQYLTAPEQHFVVGDEGIGTLGERGAGWLYLRYLADRFGPLIAGRLVRTNLTGAANVIAQTGVPFEQTVGPWALANWVSDLPGLNPDAMVRYTSWAFRSTFAALHTQRPTLFDRPFPLVPTTSAASAVDLTGTLRAGSGAYHIVRQAPGKHASVLTFSTATGLWLPYGVAPQLNVVRLR